MSYLEDNCMSEFICQICVSPFNQTEHVPKILPCGHTLCKSCVTTISQSSANVCPICKRAIVLSDHSTNYSLLKLCDAFTDKPTTLRDDVAKMYINRISKSLLDVQLHIVNAIKEATSLRAFGYENEIFSQSFEDARITFNEIKNNMSALQEKLFQSQNAPDVNINIKNLKLPEIAERIYKGEKIYAVAFINDEKKYGKVFRRGNLLFINALIDTQIPKGSSMFWLCDLLTYHHTYIFPYIAVYDEGNQQTTTYVFSDDLGDCDHRTLDVFTGESGHFLKDCTCFWKDKFTTLVIKMEKGKYLNIKIRQTKDGKSIRDCLDKSLPIPAEISVTTQQRNSVLNAGVVGKFFSDNNLTFLFPKDGGVRSIKEHGIVLGTTYGNKI